MNTTSNLFNEMQMSALNEIANIGLGHAATALADLTNNEFLIETPSVSGVPFDRIPALFGGFEQLAVGTVMPVVGDINAQLAFLFSWESALSLWELLLGNKPAGVEDVTEIQVSAMLEISNILNSSFLNALSQATNLRLYATPPLVAMEMAYAIASTLVVEAEWEQTVALIIDTKFLQTNGNIQGYSLCIPDQAGIKLLLTKLGCGGQN